jgi:citrate synthase
MGKTATLILDGKSYEFPIIQGTEGELGIDISTLRSQTGYITVDPSYGNTGSCLSGITFIDGEKGILRHRGIPLEAFADNPDFVSVAWLIIFGRRPTHEEDRRFRQLLTDNAFLDESMKHHFEGFPKDAPPMAITSAMINALSCFHEDLLDPTTDEQFETITAALMSKIRTIAAYTYRRVNGLPYMYPDPRLRYCANLLHMMFSKPYEQLVIDKETEDAVNLLLLLHADHEQNCSTSTVRMVGSSKANLFASCAAGVCALWGPLHGGANVAVMDMLEKIHQGGVSVEKYLELAKNKESGVRLMGFGHRVYKNFDPRALLIKDHCRSLLNRLSHKDPLLDIAQELEDKALKDSYFTDRKLYPNVDFYSGIIFQALGIPKSMFTVMFSIGRLPGWIANWKEQADDPKGRISRPRQIYIGPTTESDVACKYGDR